MGLLSLNRATGVVSDVGTAVDAAASRWRAGDRYRLRGALYQPIGVDTNRLYLHPIPAPFSWSIDALGVNVATAVGGATILLGVYALGVDGFPTGAPLASQSVSAATTGDKEVTFTAVAGTGPICVAALTTAIGVQVTGIFHHDGSFGVIGTAAAADHTSWIRDGQTSFPTPPAPTSTQTFGCPAVWVRAGASTSDVSTFVPSITASPTVTFVAPGDAQQFTVAVGGVAVGATILASPSGNMPPGVDFDEYEFDTFDVVARCVVAGQVQLACRTTGPIIGPRKINLIVT